MEILYLIIGLWLLIASILDLKYREIPNWLSFSLAGFGLSFMAFKSVFEWNISFFSVSLLGFVFFFIMAYLLYYSRVFAGGDAKLLIGLGPILPFIFGNYSSFGMLILSFLFFVFLLLVVGGFYGLFYSLYIVSFDFKKFRKSFYEEMDGKKIKIFSIFSSILLLLPLITGEYLFLFFPIIVFLLPFLTFYSKAVEECMVIEKKTKDLSIGDWLYEPVKIGGERIEGDWEGLSEDEIKKLAKEKDSVKIKDGIPFVPSFLFSFIILIYLWNSSWFLNNFWALRFFF